jgi:hypothetical protein
MILDLPPPSQPHNTTSQQASRPSLSSSCRSIVLLPFAPCNPEEVQRPPPSKRTPPLARQIDPSKTVAFFQNRFHDGFTRWKLTQLEGTKIRRGARLSLIDTHLGTEQHVTVDKVDAMEKGWIFFTLSPPGTLAVPRPRASINALQAVSYACRWACLPNTTPPAFQLPTKHHTPPAAPGTL